MKDYYNRFIELSLQQCTKADYQDKQKIKANNAASKALRLMQSEMPPETLTMLLTHDDTRVRINAAAMCLQSDVSVPQAVKTLKEIITAADDPTLCLSAKMLLKNQRR